MSKNQVLNFEGLPDLPQIPYLKEVVTRLWSYPEVVALWLGGSLALNHGDAHSDLDLRIALPPEQFSNWESPDFADIFKVEPLAHMPLRFGEHALLHHLLSADGIIFDLYLQSTEQALSKETRHVFACRNDTFKQKLLEPARHKSVSFRPASAEEIRNILTAYWLHAHKNKKVLYRDLDLLLWQGLTMFRGYLLRLHFIALTGADCGDFQRLSIHAMTPIVQTLQASTDTHFLDVSGLAMGTRAQKIEAVNQLHVAVSKVGHDLALKHSFDYPESLESLVKQDWAAFCQSLKS